MSSKIDCKEVITIPQFTGTCWFNALLMTLLYSDGMRKFLITNLDHSDIKQKHPKLFEIMKDILVNRYRKIDEKEKVFFDKLKPENMLSLLHQTNSKHFYFNPEESTGHYGEYYFVRLFDFLGLKKKVLYLNKFKEKKEFYYSVLNNNPTIVKTKDKQNKRFLWRYVTQSVLDMKNILPTQNPDVLVVTSLLSEYVNKKNIVMKTKQKNLEEIIEYNGTSYKLDSLLLINFNLHACKLCHQIAGVTCNDNRYLYNGWIRYTQDPAQKNKTHIKSPCELMYYDWLKDKSDFCLSNKVCEIDKKHVTNDLCFNISKGNTTYIYVKMHNEKIKNTYNVQTPLQQLENELKHKELQCDKEINDIKNRITKLKNAIKTNDLKDKKCPEDKILNPKTGRCVMKTGKLGKELMKSKN